MKLIKSISGIRGIYNKTLTKSTVSIYSKSFASIQKSGTILLARDTRPHGEILYKKIINTLINSGRDVLDCGIIPTPTAQFIIKEKKLSGGIIITASHNPIEWNGLKFLDNDGCFLNNIKMDLLLNNKNENNSASNVGNLISYKTPYKNHIKNILELKCIDLNKIKKRKFKVVVDTVNGAAFNALPNLLEKLNCEVIKLHCSNDGTFPRGTEPIPKHLNDLSNNVKNFRADIGLATDPDADRLAIVDNHGNPIGEEYTLALAVESYLKYFKRNKEIVTNLSTSMCLEHIAKKYNSTVIRSSVGEINVVEKMKEINSCIGGEGNGGVILEESHLGRDSLVATVLVLNYLAQSNLHLDEIMKTMPQFVMIKDKINIDNEVNFNDIKSYFKKEDNNRINFIEKDGLKILWQNKWLHIRKSNTEPIIRIIAEANSHNETKSLIKKMKYIVSN